MMKKPQILFVCTGNTCRSAMAEAIWRTMGGLTVGSAGVSAWTGQPAAPHALEVVKRWGASLDAHRSRDLEEVSDEPDLIITMTRGQRERVIERRPEWASRTYLLTEMVDESGDINDPVGYDLATYQAVASELDRLLVKLRAKLFEDQDA